MSNLSEGVLPLANKGVVVEVFARYGVACIGRCTAGGTFSGPTIAFSLSLKWGKDGSASSAGNPNPTVEMI